MRRRALFAQVIPVLSASSGAEPDWQLVEEVRIGPAEDGPASFGTIRGLTVDAAGRIYVLENQPQDIRVFAPNGAFVRHIGRAGAGPGEYQNANGLAWDSLGRLLVVDQQHARNSFFDTTGRFVESKTRPVSGFYGWNWGGAILRDGRTVEQLMLRESGRLAYAVVDAQDRLRDTLMLPAEPFDPRSVWVLQRDPVRNHSQVPFATRSFQLLDARGGAWLARSDRYLVVHIGPRGDTLHRLQRDVRPVPVTRQERDSVIGEAVKRFGDGPDLDRSRVPEHKGFMTSLHADDEGRLWVRVPLPADQSGAAFDVFDRDGRFLDRAATPLALGMYVLIQRGMMYASARTADDEPYVVRLRIRSR